MNYKDIQPNRYIFIGDDIYDNHMKVYPKVCRSSVVYPTVSLQCDGKKRLIYMHHVVAHHFHGERPDGLEIDHIDGDKLNYSRDNLEYVTHAENMRRAYVNEQVIHLLKHNDVRVICEMLESDMSNLVISMIVGCPVDCVSNIRRGATFKHISTEYEIQKTSRSVRLSDSQKRDIKEEISSGAKLKDIAAKFSVDPSLLSRVKSRLIWKNI